MYFKNGIFLNMLYAYSLHQDFSRSNVKKGSFIHIKDTSDSAIWNIVFFCRKKRYLVIHGLIYDKMIFHLY